MKSSAPTSKPTSPPSTSRTAPPATGKMVAAARPSRSTTHVSRHRRRIEHPRRRRQRRSRHAHARLLSACGRHAHRCPGRCPRLRHDPRVEHAFRRASLARFRPTRSPPETQPAARRSTRPPAPAATAPQAPARLPQATPSSIPPTSPSSTTRLCTPSSSPRTLRRPRPTGANTSPRVLSPRRKSTTSSPGSRSIAHR